MKFLAKFKRDRSPKHYTKEYIEELYETIRLGKKPEDHYFVDRVTIIPLRKAIQAGVLTKDTFVSNCLKAQELGNKMP